MALVNLNLEYYPESAMSHYLLGEIHMRGGDKEAAIASFERSLAINPRNRRAQQALQKLKAPAETAVPEER